MKARRTDHSLILVVEDDANFLKLLGEELREVGHRLITASSLSEAREQLEADAGRIDLILSDLRLPDGTGSELLAARGSTPMAPAFIVMTAFGSIDQAVDLLKAGADNFLTKPLDFEQLHICIERALEYRRLKLKFGEASASEPGSSFHGMIGKSPKMRNLIYEIRKVSVTDEPVLLLGESGTGKELAARAVHAESRRSAKEFVPVNCAAIPAELIESELFGHERGAFSGAVRDKAGLFQAAQGGSLFLDEIGELPLELQAKLLRALQEGKVRPVGANAEVEVDARIIAATQRNLREEVAGKRFREDLFYRLEALTVEVPALREREADIPEIALHLLGRIARSFDRPAAGFAPEVIQAFRAYPFPGNIRELENVIKKMLVFSESEEPLGADALPPELRSLAASASRVPGESGSAPVFVVAPPFPPLEQIKAKYVRHLLDAVDGNKRQAAELLGIGRRTLYDILERGD